MKIGPIQIGLRAYGTDDFKWFYHPLLRENEKQWYHFFVWFGHNIYICWHKKEAKHERIHGR